MITPPSLPFLQHRKFFLYILAHFLRVLFDTRSARSACRFTEINMSSLPSGIYLYKVEAGSLTAIRKMVFLK